MNSLTSISKRDGVYLTGPDGSLVGKILWIDGNEKKAGNYHVVFESPYAEHAGHSLAWNTLEAAEFYALAIVSHVLVHNGPSRIDRLEC